MAENCKERVAYDLASQIALLESRNRKNESLKDPRDYWLTLYRQCLDVVRGRPPQKENDKNP